MSSQISSSMNLNAHGRCAMRGTCGQNEYFGTLPCPYDGPAVEPDDQDMRSLLVSVCGSEFATGPVCCTKEQVETLQGRLRQAEALISTCPACRNNFHSLFCSFTCSPDQGNFVNITSTKVQESGTQAVTSLDLFVGADFADGLFHSCEKVQFGALNQYAMSILGGGATNASAFLKYLGDTKPLGSPFQIDFSYNPPDGFHSFNPYPRNCADADLESRCTCIDCPSICQDPPPPPSTSACRIGAVSCFTFSLVMTYAVVLVTFVIGYTLGAAIRKRRERKYERMALGADNTSDNPLSPQSHSRSLVGASSLVHYMDGEDSLGGQSGDSRQLGRGASLLDPMETLQPRQYKLNGLLRGFFYRLGYWCASRPWLTFFFTFTIIGLLNIGWKKFAIETDPVRLWVAPDSQSKLQKDFFDEHFGPFYRTEQIFLTSFDEKGQQPVLSWDHLQWWFKVESEIRDLRSSSGGYQLDDVCFKPAGPSGACVVQSLTAWFHNDLEDYDEHTWKQRLELCSANPADPDCLPDFQQPLAPIYVLGGAPQNEDGKVNWPNSKAMIITYVVSDHLDPLERQKTMQWERSLLSYLQDVSKTAENNGLHLDFSTGVSLEEELNKSTNVDYRIVVLSYVAMFLYIAITLGNSTTDSVVQDLLPFRFWWSNLLYSYNAERVDLSPPSHNNERTLWSLPIISKNLFINSKVILGIFGIGLVIMSITSSVGFFSLVGVKVTLIIAEVIPFLVLAVGVDNIFILVHELDRQTISHGPNAITVSQDANVTATTPFLPSPSQFRRPILQPSSDESADAVSMPVSLSAEERVARTLSKVGPSILLSSVTETVAFALGSLVPMPAVRNFALYAAGSIFLNAVLQVTVFISALTLDIRRAEARRVDCFPCIKLPSRIALPESNQTHPSRLSRLIRRHYAPFLLRPVVKWVVIFLFGAIAVISAISVQHIHLGLDQRLALPSNSYLIDYFDSLEAYFDVGPPLYFVITDVDVKLRSNQQRICGRFTTCDDSSVANTLEAERKREEWSFIAQPSASWIDDFLHWLNPLQESCCRVRKRDPATFCRPRDSSRLCKPCLADETPPWNITMVGLPEGEDFMRYLRHWLESPTDEDCPLGGQATYSSAISLRDGDVAASHMRTFHPPLKTQADFINAFNAAHRTAEDLSQRTGLNVFSYSYIDIFFDQYAHVVAISQEILGLGLAAVLVITSLLLGSWRAGTIVTGVVALIVLSVMGAMGLWNISLNALSLVNLVISLGIAVEFCAHITRAFMGSGTGLPIDHVSAQKERDDRMWNALVDVGPAVLSGITFTKLIGVSVLAFTSSKLLAIYYFRMWFALIVSGALHGLVFLPVLLSLAGGPGYPLEDADEEWMSSAVRRHDHEYTPFLADGSSDTSD